MVLEAFLNKFFSSLKEKYDKDRQYRFGAFVDSFIEKRDPTDQEQNENIKNREGICQQEVYFVSKVHCMWTNQSLPYKY